MTEYRDYIAIEERLSAVASDTPSGDEKENTFLVDVLKDVSSARLFTRYARDPSWLGWLDKHGVLKPLFDPQVNLTTLPEIEELAKWIVGRFVLGHHNRVLELIHRHQGTINRSFWHMILDEIVFHRGRDERPPSDVLAIWVTVLLSNAHVPDIDAARMFGYLLDKCDWHEDRYVVLSVLAHLLKPVPVTEREIFSITVANVDFEYRYGIDLSGDDYGLGEAWKKYKEFLPDFWSTLLPTVQMYITDAYEMNRVFGRGYDPQSAWRSAIEEHEQDEVGRRAFDILVDVARDILECLLVDRRRWRHGKHLVESWFATDVTLLQRIAVHGMAFGNCWRPDTKINWLLEKDLIYEHGFKREVFQVIRTALGRCSDSVISKLVEVALSKDAAREVVDDKMRIRAYERFNLINWMAQYAPESTIVQDALQGILRDSPNLKAREYPDLDVWTSGVHRIEHDSPVTSSELVEMELGEAGRKITDFKGKHEIRDEADRRGLLEILTTAVASDFGWSMTLANHLKDQDNRQSDTWYYLIRGWTRSSLSVEQWPEVLEFLSSFPEIHAVTQASGELLEDAIKGDAEVSDELLSQMEALSDLIWEQIEDLAPDEYYESDWLSKAINHGAGKLCEFWIQALHRRYTVAKATDGWVGLLDAYKDRFARFLTGDSYSAGLAACVLVSRMQYLNTLDHNWTVENILPQFDYQRNEERAQQAWHGFLHWGRIPYNMVGQLKTLVAGAVPSLSDPGDNLRNTLFKLVADLMLIHSKNNEPDFPWFDHILALEETTVDDRLQVLERIWLTMRGATESFAESIWTRWFRTYWVNRIDGKPLLLSNAEANKFVECLPYLKSVFPEAVEVACDTPNVSFEYTHLYSDLLEKEFVKAYPSEVNRLLVHLLKDSGSHTDQGRYLVPLFEALSEELEDGEVRELKNILVGLGVISSL